MFPAGCMFFVKNRVMKNRKRIFSMIAAGAMVFGGCASTGLTASSHITNVQLSDANYRIVATNVSGEGSAEAILGFSVGVGFGTSQVALIPLNRSRLLYGTAMKNLWENFESRHGPVANR